MMAYHGYRFQAQTRRAMTGAGTIQAHLRSFARAIRAAGVDPEEANTLEAAASIIEKYLHQAGGLVNQNGGEN